MIESNNCDSCPWRAKYDNNPKSFLGRLWRWHIKFCPGWKNYMKTLDDEKRAMVIDKYHIRN
ncbi:hypothetical protein [Plebeiibacterium sediminum]|uniref:Uncharacterized protein n=1 Tax=Plebeiibacterium sediminum TaxID=2992112 RepID=A0AAE3M2W0_9BACT|nr:hypothetical protein [Plebeiobacterium sediminum]MCW3785755.1 hypothetical protein [Plebeiobacterium sediminum]